MELYIIAGPNGAGKTTFAREFLPNYAGCKNLVNADLIAQGIAPFSPETAALRAGRTMLEEIRSFAERRVSFAFETTLSGRSYLTLLRKLKSEGYEIHFFFLWLKSVDLALSRVKERESKKEFQEADTMCPKQSSDGALIGPCKISCFTIGRWLKCGRCSTTQARSPT
jgi:predicted ABC-type ATPase